MRPLDSIFYNALTPLGESQPMADWLKTHKIALLILALGIVVIANVAIFLPREVDRRQQLTPNKLQDDTSQLINIADQAAKAADLYSQDGINNQTLQDRLNPLTSQTDDIVLNLQSWPHVISMNDDVKQTLQLAQVISFTLHDYTLNSTDQLKSAKTAQVLRQAAASAQSLNQSLADKSNH